MKFSEWLQPDTVAIKATAVYFGVPGQGHQSCHVILTHKNWTGSLEQVTREEPDIEKKHCIECGKPLLQKQEDKIMGESISKTHEWRKLEEFQEGDTIHRWGDDLPVVSVESLPDGHIRLMYRDTDNKPQMIDDRKGAEYIARKRIEESRKQEGAGDE